MRPHITEPIESVDFCMNRTVALQTVCELTAAGSCASSGETPTPSST